MTTRPPTPGTVRLVDGGWWERLRRVDPRIWDALLALGMVAVRRRWRSHSGSQRPDEPPAALGFALVVLAGTSLAWRRRAPLIVATIVCRGRRDRHRSLATGPSSSRRCGSRCTRPPRTCERDRLVRVLLPVALLTSVAISLGERWDRGLNWVEVLSDLVVTFGVPILLGRMTFNRRRRVVRDRELATREAVAAERAAIARELHDVVAHDMSVMVVQAGAARAVGASGPGGRGRGAPPDRGVRAATGLAEMRRLLEVLKADGRRRRPGAAARARAPGRAPRRDARAGPAGRGGRRGRRRDRCPPASTCPRTASSRRR